MFRQHRSLLLEQLPPSFAQRELSLHLIRVSIAMSPKKDMVFFVSTKHFPNTKQLREVALDAYYALSRL